MRMYDVMILYIRTYVVYLELLFLYCVLLLRTSVFVFCWNANVSRFQATRTYLVAD